MAKIRIQNMSGGTGSEVTFEKDDVTGALHVEIGNDRGSPVVNVGVEAQDGTIYEWSQNTRTQREVRYTVPPKARANETVVEQGPEEDVLDEQGSPTGQKRRTERFRRQQAVRAADRAKFNLVDLLDDQGQPTGDKGFDFAQTWRQEVY